MVRIIKKSRVEIKKDISGREIFNGNIGDIPLTKLKCKSVGIL